MKLTPFRVLPLLVIAPLLWSGCGSDHGIDPIPYRIKGSIVFFNGPPPFYVREVRIAAVKKLPPENLTTDLIFSDPLPFSRDSSRVAPDTVNYEIVVDPGEYLVTGLLWRRSGESWDISNILSLYIDLAKFTFKEIAITPDSPVADNVDMIADWGLAKRDASISGTINFKGGWRDDTDFFVLGFYPIIPNPGTDFINFKAFKIILQRAPLDTYSYSAAVDSGRYKFIALFWKGKNTGIDGIRAIGFYRCPNDSMMSKEVVVGLSQPVTGKDFEADFSTLPEGVRYRKDGTGCP
jgi:hypothetical protein